MNNTVLCHIHVRTCSVVIALGLIISAYFHFDTVQIQYMFPQRNSYPIVYVNPIVLSVYILLSSALMLSYRARI